MQMQKIGTKNLIFSLTAHGIDSSFHQKTFILSVSEFEG
jgi:hypothetical protein